MPSLYAREGRPPVYSSARSDLYRVLRENLLELMGGVIWSRLMVRAEKEAEFLEINYAPGAMSGASMSHREGREFGLILEGELVIELGFESYTLKAEGSIILESTTPIA